MKKLLICFIAITLFSISSNAQKKDTSATTLDTLRIDATKFKFIKVGETVIETKELKQKGFWFPQNIFTQMFDGLQEYPAKIANPATQYLIKFFNIKQ